MVFSQPENLIYGLAFLSLFLVLREIVKKLRSRRRINAVQEEDLEENIASQPVPPPQQQQQPPSAPSAFTSSRDSSQNQNPNSGTFPFPDYSSFQLSSPISSLKPYYDYVVVGSGYGGGIAAARLAQAGQNVCVLERGKETWPGQYPSTLEATLKDIQTDTPSDHRGSNLAMLDFRMNNDMWVMIGCGLGGTSLVNASVSVTPDPRVYSLFPTAIQNDLVGLDDGFAAAVQVLKPNQLPANINLSKTSQLQASAQEFQQSGQGGTYYRLPLNVSFQNQSSNAFGIPQYACTLCGNCVTSCNYGSKNTLMMNYLPIAKNNGAEIFCQITVNYLTQSKVGGANWTLNCTYTANDGTQVPVLINAGNVILSAGCLGSTEIMLRSMQQGGVTASPMVGQRFTANGDVLGFAYNGDSTVHGVGYYDQNQQSVTPVGPTITSVIDLRSSNKPLKDCYFVEEGAIPGALGPLLPALFGAASLSVRYTPGANKLQMAERAMKSLEGGSWATGGSVNNTQTYLFMGFDDGNGVLYLQDNRIRINWPDVGGESVFAQANNVLYTAASAGKGGFVKDPLYNKADDYSLVTVHPLGGCIMGDDFTSGVVNDRGQVFNGVNETSVYGSLYVLDGSIVPTPLGVNPLLTICALVERAMQLIAKEKGFVLQREKMGNLASCCNNNNSNNNNNNNNAKFTKRNCTASSSSSAFDF